MMSQAGEEYVNLDELLDDLTEDQDEIGTFSIVGRALLYPVPAAAGKREEGRRAERRSRRTRR
jgi:hypothetical protein